MLIGKRALVGAVVVCAGILTSACAPVKVVADDRVWQDSTSVIGVAVAKLPTGGAFKVGNQGLLDVAINNAVASGLEGHLAQADLSKFNRLADNIAVKLEERGLKVKRIAEPVDVATFAELKAAPAAPAAKGSKKGSTQPKEPAKAKRDFSSLAAAQQVDKLLLVSLDQAGTIRSYYGFIPMGAPAGYAAASGQLIDLKTHQLQWQANMTSSVAVAGEWDSPPAYAQVDLAWNAAVEAVMAQLGGDLMVNAPAPKAASAAPTATAATAGQ